jgi:hypothetical protein
VELVPLKIVQEFVARINAAISAVLGDSFIYGAMDPVPNGPIFIAPNENIESIEICNESSLIGDHTSYAVNRDVFFPNIVSAIARFVETDVSLKPLNEDTLSFFQQMRRIKISSEKLDQLILLVALAAVLLDRGAVKAIGEWLREWVDNICLHCWKYSVEMTGLAIVLGAYMFLRLAISAVNAIFSVSVAREESEQAYVLLFGVIRHLLACSTLSLVALFFYSATIPPDWIYSLMQKPPGRIERALALGWIAGFGLWFFDIYCSPVAPSVIKRREKQKEKEETKH